MQLQQWINCVTIRLFLIIVAKHNCYIVIVCVIFPQNVAKLNFKVKFQTYHSLNQNMNRSGIYLITFHKFLPTDVYGYILPFSCEGLVKLFGSILGPNNQPVLIAPSGPLDPGWGIFLNVLSHVSNKI